MKFRTFAPAAIALSLVAATALPAFADPAEDVGGLIALRDEVVGIPNYCFNNVKQDQAFIQARDAWLVRNAADLKVINDGVAKAGGITPDEQKQIDGIIAQRVEADVTGQSDKAAFCASFTGEMKDGTSHDIATIPAGNERLVRVRAFLAQ